MRISTEYYIRQPVLHTHNGPNIPNSERRSKTNDLKLQMVALFSWRNRPIPKLFGGQKVSEVRSRVWCDFKNVSLSREVRRLVFSLIFTELRTSTSGQSMSLLIWTFWTHSDSLWILSLTANLKVAKISASFWLFPDTFPTEMRHPAEVHLRDLKWRKSYLEVPCVCVFVVRS